MNIETVSAGARLMRSKTSRSRSGSWWLALVPLLWAWPTPDARAGDSIWTSQGPPRGSVLSIAIDPRAPSTLYAGSNAGGVFKSLNGAASWVLVVSAGAPVKSLAIAPSDPAVVYAGTMGTGILKSMDGGATWNAVNTGLGNLSVNAVVVDPRTPMTAYAGTAAGGVFRTVDGGANWTAASTGLASLSIQALAIDPATPETLYAGDTTSHVAKSTNGGASWSATGALPASGAVNALAIDPQTPQTLYAGTATGGVFKTVSGGTAWVPANSGITTMSITSLVVDPTLPNVVHAGTQSSSVFRSTSGAASWEPLGSVTFSFQGRVRSLAIDPRGSSHVYAATQAGVFRNDAGGAWLRQNVGLLAEVSAVAVAPSAAARVYAGLTFASVFQTPDAGLSWSPTANDGLALDVVSSIAVDPLLPDTVYVSTPTGASRSVDGGASWTFVLPTLVNSIAIDPGTPSTLYAATLGGSGVQKSVDGGAHWGNTGFTAGGAQAVAVDPALSTTVYAGTAGSGIFKSIDGGAQWSPTSFPAGVTVRALVPGPSPTMYAVAGSQGAFRSGDGGASWTPVTGGIAGLFVSALVVDLKAPDTLYVGTREAGVFRSPDAGSTWTPMNDGLAFTRVDTMAISSSGACLYAGTPGGVFELTVRPDPCAPQRLAAPVAAVLPGSRSVQVDAPATVFATMVDTAGFELTDCVLAPATSLPLRFSFQTTNPATNTLVGSVDTSTSIFGGGLQTFVISVVPTAALPPTDVPIAFSCANAGPAAIVIGVNTLLLSAATGPVPDIVALGATPTRDGIARIPGATGTGFFSVATVNVGASTTITASADSGGETLPFNIALCQTNPVTAECITALGPSVETHIAAGATPTFAVFLQGLGFVPFDPGRNRVFVRFTGGDGVTRGSTSVAVQTE